MAIVYLNGKFITDDAAKISVLDRGFLFADSVYEVIAAQQGTILHLAEHLARLQKSLQAILLANVSLNLSEWQIICQTLLQKNNYTKIDATLYIQISRGAQSNRSYHIPKNITPTIFAYCQPMHKESYERLCQGFSAITLTDLRPVYNDIKTNALQPVVLMQAKVDAARVDQAILIRNHQATEGIASNLFIVKNNTLITPALDNQILAGVTRQKILRYCQKVGIPYCERPIAVDELYDAGEVWLTSSSKPIYPITIIDDKPIADGKPGKLWQRLIDATQLPGWKKLMQ